MPRVYDTRHDRSLSARDAPLHPPVQHATASSVTSGTRTGTHLVQLRVDQRLHLADLRVQFAQEVTVRVRGYVQAEDEGRPESVREGQQLLQRLVAEVAAAVPSTAPQLRLPDALTELH